MEGWKVRDGKWRGMNERKLTLGRRETRVRGREEEN